MQCQNQKAKNKNAEGTKGKNSQLALPNSEKKLSVCLQGESPIALPSLRRRSTDEQNLRLRAQNQGSALRARVASQATTALIALMPSVAPWTLDAMMRARAGTESQEPRERAQRDVAKDEDHGHGRGRRALMLCGGLCAVARARARRQATLARTSRVTGGARLVRPSVGRLRTSSYVCFLRQN